MTSGIEKELAGGEDVRPLYLAGTTVPLFACLQRPTGGARSNRAVVICPAIGHEYERSHRALRQLAARLARAGLPSLRYDHAAQGDSGGGAEEGGPSVWQRDLERVIAEARRALGAERIAVIGFRLGATLALAARADALLLWRPVAEPAAMLDEWQRLDADQRRAIGWADAGQDSSIFGWNLPAEWRAGLKAMPKVAAGSAAAPTLILGDATDRALAQLVGGAFAEDPGPPIWLQEPMDAIVPLATLQLMIGWLEATPW